MRLVRARCTPRCDTGVILGRTILVLGETRQRVVIFAGEVELDELVTFGNAFGLRFALLDELAVFHLERAVLVLLIVVLAGTRRE